MKKIIASNLFVSFGIIVLFICAVGVASYISLTGVIDATWSSNAHSVLRGCDRLLMDVINAESGARGFLITGEQHYLTLAQTAQDSAGTDMQRLKRITKDDPAQQKRLEKLTPLVDDKFLLFETLTEKKLDTAAQAALILKTTRRMDAIMSEIGAIRNDEFALLSEQDKAVESVARKVRSVVLYGGLLTAAFTALVSFLIRSGLSDLTGKARLAARSLSEAVEQILNSTRQQTTSTAEQAAAVLQANATMQEISRSGLEIAHHAKEVSAMAERASKASNSGLGAVQNTNSAMEAIREQAEAVAENALSLSAKTQTVGEIVATVNEIAQQSHLLALNAAIQAAAAGEHGLAFAVVASEIKSLADQSREATVQVRSILGDIQKSINTSVMLTEEAVKRVELGKQQAEVAAGTIREINDSIQQSVHAFQHIVGGTNEQQAAFQQVAQAFKDIGHASEQTATGTRQLEGSATNLMTLGQQLAQAMDRYQV
jgi:methyl-accepting chemotaxis protein